MPQTEIRMFRSGKGEVPVTKFLSDLRSRFPKAYGKVLAGIDELSRNGNQIRRPLGAYLRDGIFELRIRLSKINYRLLYAFNGQNIAVLTHGFTKKDVVPPAQIETAMQMMTLVRENPTKYTADFHF